jgi:hypothetical protein
LQCGVAQAPRAAGVSPPWLRTASGTAIAHTPDRLSNQVWVRKTHLRLVAKVAGWLLASAARRGLVGGGFSVVCRELTCSCVWGTTVGSRQPLLLHDVRSPGNDLLQCGVAHAPRAATVSPPWLRTASAAAIAHTPAAIDCYTRAGGVSPPWVREPHLQLVAKVAEWLLASVSPPWFNQRRCKRERFPRLAHADCSWRTTLRPAGE